MNLVIVESPSKAKTIEKYLGSDYKVLSSVGHIRDLATSGFGGFGVDVEDHYKPDYKTIRGKGPVVKELKAAAKKVDHVYLATDPDREGEAIAFHLYEVLNLNEENTNRVVFNEITKNAVIKGIANPRTIDYNLVNSQETRRIIDRIIGFRLSKILWKKIKSKSAGRVQSVALMLVCNLEDEIKAFNPVEYFEIYLHEKRDFNFKLEKYNGKNIAINNQEEADAIVDSLDSDFKITDVVKKNRKSSCNVAFITSTLQQNASRILGFSAKKTMMLAQRLYEGINIGEETTGLITYMRTDSTRLSEEFLEKTKEHILNNYGTSYYKGYHKKNRSDAQDAHEAIRPTTIGFTPSMAEGYLGKDELRLYTLIYNRVLASNMTDALYEETVFEVLNNGYLFTTSAKIMVFDGYTKVYNDADKDVKLIKLDKGETLNVLDVEKRQLFTKAPARYTEAKLIKKLESLGIGRPSTYASIIETLKIRGYVLIEEKKFFPTEQGMLTTEKLAEYFNKVVNVEYTATMEQDLDKIALGNEDEEKIINDFYHPFMEMCDYADKNMLAIPPKEVGIDCPECGHPLVERLGRFGKFVACSNYPECKYILKEKKVEPKKTGVTCPKCGTGELVIRIATRGRNKGKEFYACNNFPKCKYVVNDLEEVKNYDPEVEAQKDALKKKAPKKKTATKKKATAKKTTAKKTTAKKTTTKKTATKKAVKKKPVVKKAAVKKKVTAKKAVTKKKVTAKKETKSKEE